MPTLYITRGISGSGKSTWARSRFGAVVVSRDDLRAALFGSDGPDYYAASKEVLRDREDYITKIEKVMIETTLKAGKDVVSDNTHTMMKYVNQTAKIGYRVGAKVEVVLFDVPLDVALARVKGRAAAGGRSVPEGAMRRQHDQLQGSKNHTLNPPAPLRPYHGTPGKPKAFLFDLDGTVYHMNNKRGPYDHNVDVDDPDPVVQGIVNTLATAPWESNGPELVAIAMSGRKTVTRFTTIAAMNRDNLWADHLFMRADGDDRADNIIKAELFDTHVRDNFDVQFVLDDRNQVVDMWRAMGLKCLQVAEGDF